MKMAYITSWLYYRQMAIIDINMSCVEALEYSIKQHKLKGPNHAGLQV